MLTAAKVLSRVQGHGITLVPSEAGNRLRFHPASALTPEMIDELRQHKEDILAILRRREEGQKDTSHHHGLGGRLRAIARERAQRKDSSPPPPAPGGGRDPLVHRGTDKAEFFKRGGNWRSVPPTDWTPYRPGGAA